MSDMLEPKISLLKVNTLLEETQPISETEAARDSDYIFVYGTLRGDSPTGAHKEYLQHSDFVAPAKVRGELFLIDYYPGFVQSLEDSWVTGEIYLLQNKKQLHQLDVYEGCAKNSPQPHEYKRELIDVTLPNSENISAWAYIFVGDLDGLDRIESGDFLRRT